MRFVFALVLLFPFAAFSQQAGKFDHYLLSLSWSPEYCYSHRESLECSQHLGLIVHGLWPQYNGQGRGPEDCGQQPGPADASRLLDMMPSVSLVEHEWATHGTCSGLSADEYFGLIRRLYSNFHSPPQLQQPRRQVIVRTFDLKRAIVAANPGINESEIALSCRGRYLSEVELCFSKGGRPQPCSTLRECRGTSVIVSAVR